MTQKEKFMLLVSKEETQTIERAKKRLADRKREVSQWQVKEK